MRALLYWLECVRLRRECVHGVPPRPVDIHGRPRNLRRLLRELLDSNGGPSLLGLLGLFGWLLPVRAMHVVLQLQLHSVLARIL